MGHMWSFAIETHTGERMSWNHNQSPHVMAFAASLFISHFLALLLLLSRGKQGTPVSVLFLLTAKSPEQGAKLLGFLLTGLSGQIGGPDIRWLARGHGGAAGSQCEPLGL